MLLPTAWTCCVGAGVLLTLALLLPKVRATPNTVNYHLLSHAHTSAVHPLNTTPRGVFCLCLVLALRMDLPVWDLYGWIAVQVRRYRCSLHLAMQLPKCYKRTHTGALLLRILLKTYGHLG